MENIQLNGTARSVEAAAETPLLWVLRDEIGMTGTKFGCGMALCGACTVHLDGEPVRSCITPLQAARGKAVATIEHMEKDRVGRTVQQAWVEMNVAQCGYCQAGQIMSAVSLLKVTPAPNDRQIDEAMSGNICRCGTYPRIRAAIKLASGRLAKGA